MFNYAEVDCGGFDMIFVLNQISRMFFDQKWDFQIIFNCLIVGLFSSV